MAKKARRKLEEDEEPAFEFPPFDEEAFAQKEFEIGTGMLLIGLITLVIGVLAWGLSVAGLPWFVPLLLGFLVIGISPFIVQHLRKLSSLYTKGDWAGLLAFEFFGFLALWFLLLSVAPNAI
jgi:hypothetical protein